MHLYQNIKSLSSPSVWKSYFIFQFQDISIYSELQNVWRKFMLFYYLFKIESFKLDLFFEGFDNDRLAQRLSGRSNFVGPKVQIQKGLINAYDQKTWLQVTMGRWL